MSAHVPDGPFSAMSRERLEALLRDPERAALGRQVLEANTLAEVRAAQRGLEAWLRRHPDDLGMLAGGEQLAAMLDALAAPGRETPTPDRPVRKDAA